MAASAAAAEPKSRFYDLPRILDEIERSETAYEITPLEEDADAKVFADAFWPPKNGIESPQVIETPKFRRLAPFPRHAKAAALVEKAEPSFQQGEFMTALGYYEEALRLDPRCYEALLYSGDCSFKLKLPKDALDFYRKAIALNPDDFRGHFFAASALTELNRPREALDAFTTTLALRPRRPSVISRLKAEAKILGVSVHDAELAPRASVEKKSDGALTVRADAEDLPWFAYAMCKAYWLGDGRRTRGRGDWSSDEEVECLAALLTGYLEMLGKSPSRKDPELDRLHAILKAGYLNEYMTYEIASRMEPNITLLLDPADRKRMKTFVSTFVIVPAGNKN